MGELDNTENMSGKLGNADNISPKIAPDCQHDCDSLALNQTSSVQFNYSLKNLILRYFPER